MKSWAEFSLYTEDQKVTLQPNEDKTCLVLRTIELDDKKESRLYLTFSEAEDFITIMQTYIELNR